MAVLKALALGLLGLLLPVSLVLFGLTHTVNGTVLNPQWLGREIGRVPLADIAEEVLQDTGPEGLPPEVMEALLDTLVTTEPVLKQQLNTTLERVGAYLRGEQAEPELASVLSSTFLNSEFVGSVLEKVPLATIAESAATEGMPEEYAGPFLEAVTALEADLKAGVTAAADPVFSYILGQTGSLDLARLLRREVFTTEFTISLLDHLDITALSQEFLEPAVAGVIPPELDFLEDAVAEAVAALQPAIQQALSDAADALMDYLLGLGPGFRVTVSLEDVRNQLETTFRETIAAQMPEELQTMPEAERERLIDDFISQALDQIPASIELDETFLGADLPEQISGAISEGQTAISDMRREVAGQLAEVEDRLAEARSYIGYFLSAYWAIIGLLAVCLLGIIGLHHNVKGASRQIGITILIVGIIIYVALVLGQGYALDMIDLPPEMPASAQDLPAQLIADLLSPLQTLGLGLAIGGVVLVVVSFVYPRLRPGTGDG